MLTKIPVVFTDIRFEHMKRIVQYLYTGKTQIRTDELDEFFRVAKQLEILGLYHEIDRGDLSIVTESASSMANISLDTIPPVLMRGRKPSNRDPLFERKRQECKRTMNRDKDVNKSATNNSRTTTSQRNKNDRKRIRVEKPTEAMKSEKKFVPLSTATIPSGQSNGTPSKANGKTASKNGANNRIDKSEAY